MQIQGVNSFSFLNCHRKPTRLSQTLSFKGKTDSDSFVKSTELRAQKHAQTYDLIDDIDIRDFVEKAERKHQEREKAISEMSVVDLARIKVEDSMRQIKLFKAKNEECEKMLAKEQDESARKMYEIEKESNDHFIKCYTDILLRNMIILSTNGIYDYEPEKEALTNLDEMRNNLYVEHANISSEQDYDKFLANASIYDSYNKN